MWLWHWIALLPMTRLGNLEIGDVTCVGFNLQPGDFGGMPNHSNHVFHSSTLHRQHGLLLALSVV